MKVVSFDNEKDRKEYGVNSLLNDIKNLHEEEGIETLITVYKKKDGRIGAGATYCDSAEIVGLLEMGKLQIMDDSIE